MSKQTRMSRTVGKSGNGAAVDDLKRPVETLEPGDDMDPAGGEADRHVSIFEGVNDDGDKIDSLIGTAVEDSVPQKDGSHSVEAVVSQFPKASIADVIAKSREDRGLPPIHSVGFSLPVLELSVEDKSYITRHVEVQLDQRQANAFKGLLEGLHEHHLRLDCGRHVDKAPDAIRWIMDQIATFLEGKKKGVEC